MLEKVLEIQVKIKKQNRKVSILFWRSVKDQIKTKPQFFTRSRMRNKNDKNPNPLKFKAFDLSY